MSDLKKFILSLAARKATERAAMILAAPAAMGWGITFTAEQTIVDNRAFLAAVGAWAIAFGHQAWKHYVAPRIGR